jgi:dipeptidase E
VRRGKTGRHLVFYSGGQERRNALIHEELIDLALGPRSDRSSRRPLRMTYVPFCSEGSAPFFRRFQRRYGAFGATDFDCLPFDDPELRDDRRAAERRILGSDVVYLAGGNTYYFLKHMRRSGLMPTLRRFADRGGVLAGLSAGALLLTPNIGLAGYPPFDRDENEVGLRNESALGLVGFEFFPHYRRSPKLRDALARYSRRSGRPLYACPDGSGLLVEGDRFTAHGEVWLFVNGQYCRIGA